MAKRKAKKPPGDEYYLSHWLEPKRKAVEPKQNPKRKSDGKWRVVEHERSWVVTDAKCNNIMCECPTKMQAEYIAGLLNDGDTICELVTVKQRAKKAKVKR